MMKRKREIFVFELYFLRVTSALMATALLLYGTIRIDHKMLASDYLYSAKHFGTFAATRCFEPKEEDLRIQREESWRKTLSSDFLQELEPRDKLNEWLLNLLFPSWRLRTQYNQVALEAFENKLASIKELEPRPLKIGQPDWSGGVQLENAQAVIDAVAKTFRTYGRVTAADPILVYQTTGPSPIAIRDAAPGGERVIRLATRGPYWSQIAYQFAHEYCHVLTKHWTASYEHRNMWFAESLCELASLWCLEKMGDDWLAGNAPYPNWQSYGESLKTYVTDHIKDTPTFNSAIPFAEWLASNLDTLRNDRTKRDLNTTVAVRLLPLFRKNPALWNTVPFLNNDINPDDDFQTHLQRWHDAVPDKYRRASVRRIAAELGFPLKQG